MNNRRDVRPDTDGREETGCTGQYGFGIRRHGESFWHSTHRYGDGDATMDGSTRSGIEDGWGHVREDNSKSGGGGRRSFGVIWGQYGTEAGQRTEPAALHSSTGTHQQEDTVVVKDVMKKFLYADDLALMANGKQELQETLEEWNGLFTRHGQSGRVASSYRARNGAHPSHSSTLHFCVRELREQVRWKRGRPRQMGGLC